MKAKLYLYSIADKSFMYRNPVSFKDDWSNVICSNEYLQPIKVNYTGTPDAYPYYLTMDGYVFNSASSTQTGICANTYTPHDTGNQTAIAEEGDFDPTEALATMKATYQRMNIKTAVDDYGSGYSNVSNLLRYKPDYVKIDRSLLTRIEESPQKQHFVRDIIEFSHDNGILALAEGVETEAELKTVIMLGVDLVQGYFTARPEKELVQTIEARIAQAVQKYASLKYQGTES